MRQVNPRPLLWALVAAGVTILPSFAQLATGYRPVPEVGLSGARLQPGALAPNRRKWFLPQNLYYEYGWRSWEYSNYARDQYQRYVSTTQEGDRFYDTFGGYIGRGWRIYDWTERSPVRQGSSLLKGQKYRSWFGNLLVSSAHHGQFHTALMVGDQIRTTLPPLTFSKPSFNGLQWDFLSDDVAVTLIGSRLSSVGIAAVEEDVEPAAAENTTRLLGARGVAQVTDFAKVGVTWVNAHNATTQLGLADNSLKGVLTGPQNLGNMRQVVIRITDDSPETPESGAVVFVEKILIDGEEHPETPLVRSGGVTRDGRWEVAGTDAMELAYAISDSTFWPVGDLQDPDQARRLEFLLVVANDYRVEVKSNFTKNRRGEEVYLPVARAPGEVTDGSNQRFVRFAYGLPTGQDVISVDLELRHWAGFDLRAEYAVNHQYKRYPNQNFRKLPVQRETADAAYATASYVKYPWFAYAEGYSMDARYSTTAFIGDAGGRFEYDNEISHHFEFVDDNDDMDAYADWQRVGHSFGGDLEVFPGLDENNDFISDLNQNQNAEPDYSEPFLRYTVDAPEFLFGVDMNNNTIIDRFEDDRAPDYPYPRDLRGYNAYGGLRFTEDIQLAFGRLRERQLSSARRNHLSYGLLTMQWNRPTWRLTVIEHVKSVRDNIPDDRLLWDEATDSSKDFEDPLELQDGVVTASYLEGRYTGLGGLNLGTKAKYEHLHLRGDQASDPELRSRYFLGLISKADYVVRISEKLSFWPRWKSECRRQLPMRRDDLEQREVVETFFFTGRYLLLPTMWVDFGVERRLFANLVERPDVPPAGYREDYNSWVGAILYANVSDYLGYRVTTNVGVQVGRQELPEETVTESRAFVRMYAAISKL